MISVPFLIILLFMSVVLAAMNAAEDMMAWSTYRLVVLTGVCMFLILLVADFANDLSDMKYEAVARGYAQICLETNKWAWVSDGCPTAK